MNAFIKTLASCAFLGAAGGTIAAPVYFPDGQFNSGKGSWGEVGPLTSFSYPENGGSDGSGGVGNGYGVMNATNGQWGIWVNSNDNGTFLPLAPGLVAGNGYSF